MNRKTIFDIGMHTGEDTEFYLKKGFHVIAVEANPTLINEGKQRFASEIENGRLELISKAISSRAGSIKFFINNDRSVWGTASAEYAKNFELLGADSKEIAVEAVTMKQIFDEYGTPYYMKIDIEGFDHLCIEALLGRSEVPKFVSLETHQYRLSETLGQLDTLIDSGYDRFMFVLQNDTHKQVCPSPSQEGKYIDHKFPVGSSGLFGEEVPGHWLTYEQAKSECRRIYRNISMIGPHTGVFRNIQNRWVKAILVRIFSGGTGWFDLHAKKLD